jgi:hypothetical protein
MARWTSEMVVVPGPEGRRDVWRFFYLESAHTLRVSRFERQARPTARHKWRAVATFDAYRRGGDIPCPPVPPEVQAQAVLQFTVDLTVTPWPER